MLGSPVGFYQYYSMMARNITLLKGFNMTCRQPTTCKAVCFQMSSVCLAVCLRHRQLKHSIITPPSSILMPMTRCYLVTSTLLCVVVKLLFNPPEILMCNTVQPVLVGQCPTFSYKAFKTNPSLMNLPLGRITLTWGILAVGGD